MVRAIVPLDSKFAFVRVAIVVPPTYGSDKAVVEYLKIIPDDNEDMPDKPAAVNVKLVPAHTRSADGLRAAIVGQVYTVTVLVAVALEQPPVPATVYVIVAVPVATPVTTPVDELTVATEVLLDVHVPPVTVEPNVVLAPTKTLCIPESVPVVGGAVTVTFLVAVALPQPPTGVTV